MHLDSIHFADSLKYYTLNKHRVVYGGGGIMPDYFIPLDTTVYTKYYRNLSRKNIVIDSYLSYIDNHRAELKSAYKKFEKYNEQFEVPTQIIDTIYSQGKKMNVEPIDETEVKQTTATIKTIIKALIARDLWEMSEYYAIVYEDNDIVKKAIELLQ